MAARLQQQAVALEESLDDSPPADNKEEGYELRKFMVGQDKPVIPGQLFELVSTLPLVSYSAPHVSAPHGG